MNYVILSLLLSVGHAFGSAASAKLNAEEKHGVKRTLDSEHAQTALQRRRVDGDIDKPLDLHEELFKICSCGDEHTLEQFVHDHGNTLLNKSFEKDKSYPLLSAAQSGNVSVVQGLLRHGSQLDLVNEAGCGVLHCAAQQGRAQVVKALHQELGDDRFRNLAMMKTRLGETALHTAAAQGMANVATVFQTTLSRELFETLVSMKTDAGLTLLHAASQDGHVLFVHTIYTLLGVVLFRKLAVEPDQRGFSALHAAAEQGQSVVLKEFQALLAEDYSSSVMARTHQGHTILHVAAHAGHRVCFNALWDVLEYGNFKTLALEQPNNEHTALHAAAFAGHVDVITALHSLLEPRDFIVLADKTTCAGQKAYDIAVEKGHDSCAYALRAWQAGRKLLQLVEDPCDIDESTVQDFLDLNPEVTIEALIYALSQCQSRHKIVHLLAKALTTKTASGNKGTD